MPAVRKWAPWNCGPIDRAAPGESQKTQRQGKNTGERRVKKQYRGETKGVSTYSYKAALVHIQELRGGGVSCGEIPPEALRLCSRDPGNVARNLHRFRSLRRDVVKIGDFL